MTRAVLSLGANVGGLAAAEAAVRTAIDALGPALVRVSALYRTPPWGGVEQDDFVNATAVVDDPNRDARAWLEFAHEREQAAHRIREVRWGPRTLDVDVIAVWDGADPVISQDERLILPHPRAHRRAFVLKPWLDADPRAQLPGHGPVRELLEQLPPDEVTAVKVTAQ